MWSYSSWLWKGRNARPLSRHRPLPCPVVFRRGLSFTQAFECGSFSANMPQVLVLEAPHRGLGKDWNGRWEEEEQEDSLIHDSLKSLFPCWKSLPLSSSTPPGHTDPTPSSESILVDWCGVMEWHFSGPPLASSTELLPKQVFSGCLITHQSVRPLSKHLLTSYFEPNDSVIWV